MRRSMICGWALGALMALTACGSTTTPAQPTPNPVTETFSNTLAPNGAFTHTFTASASGTVTATLTSVTPDNTVSIGFSMGTWLAATSTCSAVLANDAAVQGATLSASAATSGNFCVRLYDVGHVTADKPETYTVTVTHP